MIRNREAAVLVTLLFNLAPAVYGSDRDPSPIVSQGINWLSAPTAYWANTDGKRCFSCHYSTEPFKALRAAEGSDPLLGEQEGIKRFKEVVREQILRDITRQLRNIAAGRQSEINGGVATMTAALDGLRALGHSRDTFTDSVVFWLLDNVQPDGSWEHTTSRGDRPPSEGSPFTATTASKFVSAERRRISNEKA